MGLGVSMDKGVQNPVAHKGSGWWSWVIFIPVWDCL